MSASSGSSISPRYDNKDDEILIDFASRELPHMSATQPRSDDGGEIPSASSAGFTSALPAVDGGKLPPLKQSQSPPPAFDMAVAEDGDILLVGPNYNGTEPFIGGNSAEYTTTTPVSTDVPADDDDGREILLVSPNCTVGTHHFLDGGKFGEFPPEIGFRKTTNPFLADILATSTLSGNEAAVSNGIISDPLEQYTASNIDILAVGPDTGTGVAFRRSPFTGRVLSPPIGHQSEASPTDRWSPGCGEVTGLLSSFRPQDITIQSASSSPPVAQLHKAGPVVARLSPGCAGKVPSPLLSSFRPRDIVAESTTSRSPVCRFSEAHLPTRQSAPKCTEATTDPFSTFHTRDIAISLIGGHSETSPSRDWSFGCGGEVSTFHARNIGIAPISGYSEVGPSTLWSSASGEVAAPLSSFRPRDVGNESASSLPITTAAAGGLGMVCETDLDNSIVLSTSPVAFIVS